MTPEQLRTWRKKLKLSQVGFAKLIRHTTQAVYQWESGRRKVPGFLDILLPLLSVGHVAQYRATRKTKRQKPA